MAAPAIAKPSESDVRSARLAEFGTLRDEAMKRMEFRYQINNLVLVAAGSLLTLGSQDGAPPSVPLIYPLLSLFLLGSWLHNASTVRHICDYIRSDIEPNVPGLNWEGWLKANRPSRHPYGLSSVIPTMGLILTTQLLAFALALMKPERSSIDVLLFAVAGASVAITWVITAREALPVAKWLLSRRAPDEVLPQAQ